MSTFFIFLEKLLSFDFAWIIDLILGNLLWLFMFSVAVYILFDHKKFFVALIVISLAFWLWGDFESLTGVGFGGGKVLLLYYISKMAVLGFVAHNEKLKKNLVVISTIQGVTALFIASIIF